MSEPLITVDDLDRRIAHVQEMRDTFTNVQAFAEAAVEEADAEIQARVQQSHPADGTSVPRHRRNIRRQSGDRSAQPALRVLCGVNENGPSIEVRALAPADAEALLALRQRNRAYFAPSEPLRDDAWFTIERQRAAIMADAEACARGDALVFGVFADGRLVGRVALTGIVRGPFLNAYLSYAVDRDYVNRGIATLAVTEMVRRAWLQGLHRVQAAVSPHNFASKRVLRKAGFRREGLAKRYLRLGGEWADQELWAVTVEDDPCAQNLE